MTTWADQSEVTLTDKKITFYLDRIRRHQGSSIVSFIVGDVIDLETGLPLDPGTTYFVAVNDFMAAGGDEYFTLAENPQVNSYVLVRDLVVDWVKANSPFAPPDPAVEQRMTITGTPPD